MTTKEKIKLALVDSKYRKFQIVKTFAKCFSDRHYLELIFPLRAGYQLNLDNPQTFNEKLQWLKLYDHRPEYTQMVDKVEAKKYVSKIIGEEYIIPTLAVYERAEEIDFDALPNQFVLKCSHDSGGIVICKDKSTLNRKSVVRRLSRGIGKDYYYQNREWPYKNVKPRIIAEQYMSDLGSEIDDYKVHNFNGTPKFVLLCRDRYKKTGLTEDFYDTEWNHLDIKRPGHPQANENVPKPEKLHEILRLASKLSEGIPFVRSDFYIIGNKVYFGELTFFPAGGMRPFVPSKWDKTFGDWITLPNKNY